MDPKRPKTSPAKCFGQQTPGTEATKCSKTTRYCPYRFVVPRPPWVLLASLPDCRFEPHGVGYGSLLPTLASTP
jgi:hypothetical protein